MRSIGQISLLTLILALVWPGIASAGLFDFLDKPAAEITRVKYERIELSKKLKTHDPMIAFEQRYLLYGAYKSVDYYAREGKYYTVFWRSDDRSPGLVVRFEYLQANTEDKIKVQETPIEKVKRGNITKFKVTGEEFRDDGNVLAWRVSLVRNGEVVATSESFLWD